MQEKKIFALAIAGLVSGGAFAQSNVTISGLLGATVYVNNAKGSGSTYAINNDAAKSNGLSFSGVEDLGGGLKATFLLSEGLDVLTGATGSSTSGATTAGFNNFSRAANVGLAGAFGKVTLGRQAVPTYRSFSMATNFGFNSDGLVNFWGQATSLTGSANPLTGLNAPLPTNNSGGARLAGSYVGGVGYSSPKFSGFEVNLFHTWGNGVTGSSFNNNGMTDVSLVYDNGTIGGVAAFNATQNKVAATASGTFPAVVTDSKIRIFGLSYKTGPIKVTGSYFKQTYDPYLAATNHDMNCWDLGASYAVGSNMRYGIDYAVLKDSVVSANKAVGTNFYADYLLSKRTDVFAILSNVKNSGASVMAGLWKVNALSRTGSLDARNGNTSIIALGINHRF